MHSLLERQRELQSAIVATRGVGDRPDAPIAVYRNAYRARLAGALRLNYPAVAALLGVEAFADLANRYAEIHPPAHFSIRWHGQALPRLLEPGPLTELAQMDWALGLAFDAADARAADETLLAAHPVSAWAEMAFALHPAVSVLAFEWAVEPQWDAIRDGREIPEATLHRHALMAWRQGLETRWRIATAEEGAALRLLASLGTLQGVCDHMEDAQRVGEWFARWIHDGLLVPGRGGRA